MHFTATTSSPRSSWTRTLFTAGAAFVASAVTSFAQPMHLTKGLQLVDEITGSQATGVVVDGVGISLNRYGGSWNSTTDASYIRFANFGSGILPSNNTKCAPLVTHLLKHCYNWSWSSYTFFDPVLKTNKKSASPAPYQYIALLKAGQGFASQVTRLDQAQPGDIMLWWQVGTDDKDHVTVIVNVDLASGKAYPSQLAGAKPEYAGTTYYEVGVLDSSSSLHTNDTRVVLVDGVETHIPGIGTGTIGVLVDANFEIKAITWSLPNSDYDTQPTGWLNGLHTRLKALPAYETLIGRMPAL